MSDPPGKLVAAVHEAHRHAGRMLGNPAAVDAALTSAASATDASAELARTLPPLLALVRDYQSGRWRDCDRDDIEWALAAIIYVDAQWDLVPDYLARGLQDDEQVVAWVGRRIFKTLVEHQASTVA